MAGPDLIRRQKCQRVASRVLLYGHVLIQWERKIGTLDDLLGNLGNQSSELSVKVLVRHVSGSDGQHGHAMWTDSRVCTHCFDGQLTGFCASAL
jgi:hypothetical protein